MGAQERLALINENLAEVLNPELIENALASGRNPKIYWGGLSYYFLPVHGLVSAVTLMRSDANVAIFFKELQRQEGLIADTLSRP